MFLKIILNYIFGYLSISVEGYFIERFINICKSKGVLLWNLKRKKSSFLYVNIGIKEFKKIKEIAKKTKCRIKIEEKKGVPFFLHRYKKRKMFVIFLIIVFLAIFSISNFIWNIEIVGNETISKEELQKQLEENGLKIGILKQKVNSKDIIQTIRLQRNDIAWMGINLKGTNAKVEIAEATKKPEIVDEKENCNIISQQDGIITKINVQNGTALVKVGDIVKKR